LGVDEIMDVIRWNSSFILGEGKYKAVYDKSKPVIEKDSQVAVIPGDLFLLECIKQRRLFQLGSKKVILEDFESAKKIIAKEIKALNV
jgi:hypothetical protein